MVILGSTGSIGVSALQVARAFNIKIEALSCNANIDLLNKQIKEFHPKFVCIANKRDAHKICNMQKEHVFFDNALMLESCKSQNILNAIVGFSGLKASLKTKELNKNLLLANKESLVIAGNLLQNVRIIPIDSEHFSLWYLLRHELILEKNTKMKHEICAKNKNIDGAKNNSYSQNQYRAHENYKNIKKLIITASGGALRDYKIQDLKNVTLKDVLAHPNWSMGQKITIDSASMVNKLYEILEAYFLFNTHSIDAIIERSSSVHSLVEFKDNCINANLSIADMKLPIAFAFNEVLDLNFDMSNIDIAHSDNSYDFNNKSDDRSFIKKLDSILTKKLTLQDLVRIKFELIDEKRYTLWRYKDVLLQHPHLGIVLNVANEFMLDRFLQNKSHFIDIAKYVSYSIERFENLTMPRDIKDIHLAKNEITLFLQSIV